MDRRSLLKFFGSSALVGVMPSATSGLALENTHRVSEMEGQFKTGMDSVDDYIGRIGPGDVLAIAGHVLSGRTSFALTIANHFCRFHGKDVIYWGPHIDQDAMLATAIQTFSLERVGTLHLRCTHNALGDVSSINLGLLIVDNFEKYLASHDSNWNMKPKLIEEKLGELQLFAAQNHCLVMPLLTIPRDDDFLRDPPFSVWPGIWDLGYLGWAIEKIAKTAVLWRPTHCSPYYGGSFEKCTAFTMPRQRLRLSNDGMMKLLLMNEETGLFLDISEEEALFCSCKYMCV